MNNNVLGWRTGALAVVLGLSVLSGGCAPRLLQDYAVRSNDVVFVVQQGSSYTLGDCKRGADGTLTDCKLHEVEFE